jgi:NAD(P)-dependent dehydrogenase (short-subunit alcohol dehydrogenase family)
MTDTPEGRLAGRVALVTGASRGIGFAIAQRFVAEGARVAITARKPEALAEAVEALGGERHALGVAGRGDDPAHRALTVGQVAEVFGPIDVLVNNTGTNPVYGPLLDLDLGAARKIMEVNVIGALGWTQAAFAKGAPAGASVVNVASTSGLRPARNIAFYGVSKAALIHLTASLAAELAPDIRVNGVAPSVVKTRFAGALYEGREDEVAAQYPMKRLGVPEDVAGAVTYLASPEAGWITGQTVVLDGGMLL